ncbi:MAG: Por secretion system protein, partial [Bacteroidota bacterium]|nr:Por secretion system protein [Bacteroidota bacterium]
MKIIKHFVISLILVFTLFSASYSQVVVTVPVNPTDLDSVTVIFDATQGNAGLKDVSPPIYAHTGVITNLSTSSSDWKYVIAAWNVNIPKALMTSLGNNLYQLKLTPSIRDFYGVPQSEKILKLAFVFRNSDGTKTGREADGGDIFADVYPTVLSINRIEPANTPIYLPPNDSIPIYIKSPLADTIALYLNHNLIKKVHGSSLTDTLIASSGTFWAKQWIQIKAWNDTASVADSFYYAVIPSPSVEALPSGINDGINYPDSTSVILSLLAPWKDFCFVTGDFNDWQQDSAFYMKRTPDSLRFWLRINNLTPHKEYIFQYFIDGNLHIADPYSDKVSDPNDQYIDSSTYPNLIPYPTGKTTEIASVLETGRSQYPWENPTFSPPSPKDLVIYEILIRDFTTFHDYPSVEDTLSYLKNLGVNTIELMPV